MGYVKYFMPETIRKGSMGKLFKRLFCKHDYERTYLHMVNGGMAKLYRCTCKKCGKVRYET